MNNITLYTVTHKKAPLIKNNIFTPIQVGRFHNQPIDDYIGDDTLENISHKNPNFCELTALYWIWKNDKTSDIMGLCHYRRYFDFNAKYFQKHITEIHSDDTSKGLSKTCDEKMVGQKINYLLNNYDIIVPKKKLCKINRITLASLAMDYKFTHIIEDYDIMIKVLNRLFGNSFDYDYYFRRHYHIIHYNMLIARRDVFNAYCEWLFKIMDELEKEISISEYPYQARVFGFLSERLFTLYIHQNKLKVKYLPVLFMKNL